MAPTVSSHPVIPPPLFQRRHCHSLESLFGQMWLAVSAVLVTLLGQRLSGLGSNQGSYQGGRERFNLISGWKRCVHSLITTPNSVPRTYKQVIFLFSTHYCIIIYCTRVRPLIIGRFPSWEYNLHKGTKERFTLYLLEDQTNKWSVLDIDDQDKARKRQ